MTRGSIIVPKANIEAFRFAVKAANKVKPTYIVSEEVRGNDCRFEIDYTTTMTVFFIGLIYERAIIMPNILEEDIDQG